MKKKMKKKKTSNLKKDLRIGADLNKEFIKQPGLFYHYAGMLEDAQDILRKLNIEYSVFKATLDKRFREKADEIGEKITEIGIVSKIRRTKKWRGLKEKIAKAEYNVGMLYAARGAMMSKKEMLISLGANVRAAGEITLYETPKKKRTK